MIGQAPPHNKNIKYKFIDKLHVMEIKHIIVNAFKGLMLKGVCFFI